MLSYLFLQFQQYLLEDYFNILLKEYVIIKKKRKVKKSL